MKLSRMAMAIAVTGLFYAGNVSADETYSPTAFGSDSYYAVDESEGTTAQISMAGDEASAPCEEEAEECDPCGEPWRLQDWLQPCGNDMGITYGGWAQIGYTVNAEGVGTNTANSPVAFNHISEEITADQLWFYVEKAVDTEGCGWDWGFRMDYVFGAHAQDTQAFGDIGWDTDWNSSTDYGSALPQAYFEVGYNDVTIKAGHFFTNIGYEVVPAPENFFYSHAYTMVYGEPFTHTGILATYAASDQVSVSAGWTQGWDSGFSNANHANTFLGGVTWTSCDEDTSLAYAVNAGDFGGELAGATAGDIYMHSVVFTRKMSDNMNFILQSDYASNDTGAGSDEWYGVNGYLLYDINCCWAAGARLEWFRDDAGVRVVGDNDGADFYQATLGLNWKPHTNLVVRPEVRYDAAHGGGTPYADGTEDELFTFGVDAIFTF